MLAWQGATEGLTDVVKSRETPLSSEHSERSWQPAHPPEPDFLHDPVVTALPEAALSGQVSSSEPVLSGASPTAFPAVDEGMFSPLAVSDLQDMPSIPEPAHRWPWTFLSVGLILTLLSQGLWLQRDVLASEFSFSAPAFQAVCQITGCESAVLRNPDSMVIDSSSFVRRQDGFVLHWTVRNSSAQTLGMTALELTLKDAQDKDLVRRVLLPHDMGAPSTLAGGQTWSGELMLRIGADLPVVGYRVLSFYP
ncbi:DUF3426 domain-containing protein [Limnohabitans sp. T6-5]|uniref:DUF3426 domain-containing protein n=1 Tax=Limnohabitans sp. T6-5 TaxID=1100724 RepID=UPI0018EE5674|nr:DUF3426 domain-containing protein [Limnohabitans sp. T6-5]